MRSALCLILLAAACTPRAYAPPARLGALDSPIAPPAGETDAQLEVSRVGTVFGPELVDGGGRVRHAVSDAVIVEGEARMLHVTNGTQALARNGYGGRAGLILRAPEDHELRAALLFGVGGGRSATAGGWGSIDVGFALAGSHRWFRPIVGGDVAFNRPIAARKFTVGEDDDATTLQLASNVLLRGTAGLELGPTHRAALIGGSVMRPIGRTGVVDPTPEPDRADDVFFAITVGFRTAL
jgi:hypothetical protein